MSLHPPPPAVTPSVPGWHLAATPPWASGELDEVGRFLRSPADVMSPAAMRAMSRSRVSFADTLVTRMTSNRWDIRLVHVDVDADGIGLLGYEIDAEGTTMHFGAFSYPPAPPGHQRLFRDNTSDFFGVLAAGSIDLARLHRGAGAVRHGGLARADRRTGARLDGRQPRHEDVRQRRRRTVER